VPLGTRFRTDAWCTLPAVPLPQGRRLRRVSDLGRPCGALARLQLTRIDARAARALAAEAPMGGYARAHPIESRARIKRALEAGRDADVARSGGPTVAPAGPARAQ
jgi:hypothetical protein